ncbi:MAG TPA: TerB family tellurite resistance protein [Candidatus Omnitrophica bacterium]|nr:MAG: hypothetical protein DRP61_00425 [Candidatus Omnitrophota bacterium]RKY35785.1 MAG: hypothetical protein DRP69_00035 [Candidatus Omnitrophota bacterium]RKY44809.1 MAG: hypothetical protein DRP80_01180 [Candidatus Omnitrophota bacterium]HEC70132.1 TerB family tellurite resistance protein [Candidatus Omnitrophota bacterium]
MGSFLDKFRNKILASFSHKEDLDRLNEFFSLGVLLWEVAFADKKFLPQEEERLKQILSSYTKISSENISLVLASIKEASQERIDLYTFTHEINIQLSYSAKLRIIEELFRVACIDKELDERELELIREISELLHISHKDFIEAKIRIKKELGLKTY